MVLSTVPNGTGEHTNIQKEWGVTKVQKTKRDDSDRGDFPALDAKNLRKR